MADIFLSYTEKDRDTVRRIAETLQSVGWSVWWDRRIPAGSTWRELLESELQSMRCMVVVWSSHSVVSDWVHEEASEGRLLGRLIPVRIEAVRPPAGFREIQAADLVGWDGTAAALGMRQLIEDIERKIGRSAVAARDAVPVPAPTPPSRRVTVSRRSALIGAAVMSVGLAAIAVGAIRSGGQRHDAISARTTATGDRDAAGPVVGGLPGRDVATSDPKPIDASTDADHALAATRVAADQASASKAGRPRCGDLQLKVTMGEPLSVAERTSMERECTK